MNTKISYLYRDGANFKAFGEFVFEGAPDDDMAARLRAALFDGEYLVAAQVGLPSVAPWMVDGTPPDADIDHALHELEWPPEATLDPASKPATTFEAFVDRVERAQQSGWALGDPVP